MRGKTRQINHYGSSCAFAPAIADGLRISGLDGYTHDYNNMCTSKELQKLEIRCAGTSTSSASSRPYLIKLSGGTGEFHPSVSTGLEMYDFHARFGACPERSRRDPQLGRPALSGVEVWFAPDPAEQFHNPYLAMGNNPVSYIDPDGEFIIPAMMIGAFIGAVSSGLRGASNEQIMLGFGIGALAGAAGAGAGSLVPGAVFAAGAAKGALAGFSGGFVSGAGNAWAGGADLSDGLKHGLKLGALGAVSGALIGGVSEHFAAKHFDRKMHDVIKNLKDLDLLTSEGLMVISNELADLGVQNPELLLKELMKAYSAAEQGTLIGADGIPNSVKLGELVEIDKITVQNKWKPLQTRPGMYERKFGLHDAKFRVQIQKDPNLIVTEIRDVPGRKVLHLSSNVYGNVPTDLMTIVFPSNQALNSFRHFTYWGYPLDFVGPFQNRLR